MIKSGYKGLAFKVESLLEHREILSAVSKYLDFSNTLTLSETEKEWVNVSMQDVNSFASLLASGEVRTKTTLLTFIQTTMLDPDAVPNDVGDDPWLIAMRKATGNLSEPGKTYLATYLLTRALGYRSQSAGELIGLVFDDVYRSAANSQLPEDVWNLLKPRLPWVFFWYDWDRCEMLRSALAEVFVDRNLSGESYIHFTDDEELFRKITKLISKRQMGRDYLRNVQGNLEHNKLVTERIRIIDKIIQGQYYNQID
jgi:23S rRNA-/tRNA-specific pseudouridylate synthase